MKGIKKWSVGVLAACGMLAGLLIASTAHTQGSPNYGVAYRQLHCQGVGTNVVGSYSGVAPFSWTVKYWGFMRLISASVHS